MIAIVAFVALRMVIGLHFYGEGYSKAVDPKPFSAMFFGAAKGPMADMYKGQVWDADGKYRLNFAVDEQGKSVIDVNSTLNAWDLYYNRVVDQYGLEDAKKKKAAAILKRYEQQLRWYFDVNSEEIEEYFLALERRDRNNDDLTKREVASLRSQAQTLESELRKQRGPWLSTVDTMWDGLEREMSQLALGNDDERVPLRRVGRRTLDSETIDAFIPYFDMTIGVLLVVGLFTRLAASVGALFLLSVIISQMPGSVGAMPVWPQAIEMFGLVVLAAVGAGRFAGLDFILKACWVRCCGTKKAKTT